ncbi:hypothetical protein PENTCL1PPCAC_16785, partial [Pristionchus entomophagus]
MAGLLSYCLPAFFFKPDAVSTDIAAPLLKQKFGLTRNHGYMAMIGYYGGDLEERWKAYAGLMVIYLLFICFYVVGIIFTIKIHKEAFDKNRSKKRKFLEKRHLLCFWSQAILISVCDELPRLIWATLPLFSIASDLPDEFTKYSAPILPIASAFSIIYTVPELYIHIVKSRGRPIAPSIDIGTTNS